MERESSVYENITLITPERDSSTIFLLNQTRNIGKITFRRMERESSVYENISVHNIWLYQTRHTDKITFRRMERESSAYENITLITPERDSSTAKVLNRQVHN